METVDAWRRRKRQEIDRLASRVANAPDPGDPRDADAVTAAKLALRARLVAQRASDPDVVETNRTGEEERRLDPFDLRWRYQRFDLVVKGPSPYPGLMEDRPSVWSTRFTSSGMGAIGPLLLALQQRGARPAIVTHRDTYFETLDALQSLTPRIEATIVPPAADLAAAAREARARGADVVTVWLDSYTASDPLDAIRDLGPDDADHVVIDTTCYEATSPRIRALADRALEAEAPVALVRSHLKLDGLGVEYGRLGSVLHLATPMLSPARFGGFRDVRSLDALAGRLVGASAVPAHLNPYLGDPVFHALNRDRIARVEAAEQRFSAALRAGLADRPVVLRTFHHRLFVAFGPWAESVGNTALREALDVLVARLRGRGHAVRLANSFGFDFVAVAPFRDAVTGLDQIRLSVPDWPDPWLDALAFEVIAAFRDTRWA